MTKEEEKR